MSSRTTSRPAIRDRHAVADDQRPRAGEIAQGFQGVLGAPLLEDRDAHDDDHEAQQDHRLVGIAHREVDRSGARAADRNIGSRATSPAIVSSVRR